MENHGFQIKIPWIFMENDGFPWKTVVFPWFSMVFHGHHGKISAGQERYPLIVDMLSFFSENRKSRKSAMSGIDVVAGFSC